MSAHKADMYTATQPHVLRTFANWSIGKCLKGIGLCGRVHVGPERDRHVPGL
ncbi:MAG: hypothetical protein K2M65_01985 [Muribaculaceae bacterium]|nr:hypothetical protein [Muribaculaceae bacterium]